MTKAKPTYFYIEYRKTKTNAKWKEQWQQKIKLLYIEQNENEIGDYSVLEKRRGKAKK